MNLFIWLWSLLLLIPGIIKSFAYFATPYILAERGKNRLGNLLGEPKNGVIGIVGDPGQEDANDDQPIIYLKSHAYIRYYPIQISTLSYLVLSSSALLAAAVTVSIIVPLIPALSISNKP